MGSGWKAVPVLRRKTMALTPDRSPLLAPNIICYSCGDVLKPKAVMGPRGVDHVEYECRNKKHEPYRMESTAMLQAEMRPVRPDGTAVKL